MDLTMLRQICRRGRLTGFIQDCISNQSPFSAALMVMFPNVMTPQSEMSTVSSHSEAQHNSRGQKLPSVEYNLILDYIHALRPNCLARHYKDLPHPEDAVILPPVAVPVTHITHKGRSYSTFSMHSGNSSISYHQADGTVDAGFITSMWKQILYGESHLFIIVSPHSQLSADDASQSPYTSRPGFLGTLVYSQPPLSQKQKQVLIQQTQIKAHMANYTRPPGTFGIKAETMILMDSLHRNRE
jgi:hypothetical protein